MREVKDHYLLFLMMSAKIYCDNDERKTKKQMYESEIQTTTIINKKTGQSTCLLSNYHFIIRLDF